MKRSNLRAGFAGSFLLLFCSVALAAADVPQPGATFTVNTLDDHNDSVCGVAVVQVSALP